MSFPQFFIFLDNPTKSYFAGDTVTGKLVVECTSQSKIKGIIVKFSGTSYVYWTEQVPRTVSDGSNVRTEFHSDVFTDTDKFLKHEYLAIGDGKTSLIIQPGRREFPLSLDLPKGIPSSFVGDHGKVFYEINAEIKRSMFKSNFKAKQQFTVNAVVDLNTDLTASQPKQIIQSKTPSGLCSSSGPIGFVLKLPRTGYVPGESVYIDAELQNNSGKTVNGAKISLIQVQSFHAKNRRTKKTVNKTLVKARHGPVQAGGIEIWRENVLQIPPVPPTKLGNCSNIDVQYELELEMDISGLTFNLRDSVPLKIGTIPMREQFQALQPPPTKHEPSMPSFIQNYPDLPPPWYKEAMVLPQEPNPNDVNSPKIGDPPEFVPNYVTYGWVPIQKPTA